jgi:predicted DNA-binding protein
MPAKKPARLRDVSVTVYLRPETLTKLKAKAAKNDRSMAYVIREAVEKAVRSV